MSKKNRKPTYADRLKYMHVLEEGYAVNYIHVHYGINKQLLAQLWEAFQHVGSKALSKNSLLKSPSRISGWTLTDFAPTTRTAPPRRRSMTGLRSGVSLTTKTASACASSGPKLTPGLPAAITRPTTRGRKPPWITSAKSGRNGYDYLESEWKRSAPPRLWFTVLVLPEVCLEYHSVQGHLPV